MPTHKKGHDKDKYYHLAKDQGYRSRAAYKLLQINKRYDFLSKARVCIDLCAAPGGWCQVAEKLMPSGSIVLGVDLLPIRAIRNVKTIISDITTTECRRQITSELHGWKADVVLCDGAPNIGSAYQKDAYVQNELVLAALKVATEHLIDGGTFCTKVYRSKDYNSLLWVLQQLFIDVQAIKPNSSRSQSSEIFLVCLKYLNPTIIDPKFLDPNHVFKDVVDESSNSAKVDVMHKKFDQHNKRHRTGYADDAGVLLSKSCTVDEFIHSKDPVRLLTDMNLLDYTSESQELYGAHKATNSDIMVSFRDLRVLGKLDFKKLLKWRLLMLRDIVNAKAEGEEVQVTIEEIKTDKKGKRTEPLTEEEIQEEIMKRRENIEREKRKEKKKSRELASKERARQALGINNNSFGYENERELFTLNDDLVRNDLDGIDDVELNELSSNFDEGSDSENEDESNNGLIVMDDNLEAELEQDYLRYASRDIKRKERASLREKPNLEDDIREGTYERTVTSKKARLENTSNSKISKIQADDENVDEDQETQIEDAIKGYVSVLTNQGGSDSDGENDESEDEENQPPRKKQIIEKRSDRINTHDELSASSKALKWFSNPIFKETVVTEEPFEVVKNNEESENEDDEDKIMNDLNLPLTDKKLRQIKRKKDAEKKKQKEERRQKQRNLLNEDDGMFSSGLEITPALDGTLDHDDDDIDVETAKVRDLIRRGMGKAVSNEDKNTQFHIAPAEVYHSDDDERNSDDDGPLSIGKRVDSRTYGSDEEIYDNHDKAMTLAVGTMMLRKSRKKALVDASYNRYAWNDPKELPSWFLDDEFRHNRPQLPVPNALLDNVKGKFQKSGSHEIKKVAEARMRKRKRAMNQLKAAKAQAKTFAENPDLSEKQKIKAIQKAMKGSSKVDKPGKVYVVTRQHKSGSMGTSSGGKGKLKFVDKRMKADTRAVKAKAKKGKRKSKH